MIASEGAGRHRRPGGGSRLFVARAFGEGITRLAKEAGTSWNRLWGELTKLGYRKEA
jgi:hypothetical protein